MSSLINSADEGFVLLLGDTFKALPREVLVELHGTSWLKYFRPLDGYGYICLDDYRADSERLGLVREVLTEILAVMESHHREVVAAAYGLGDGVLQTKTQMRDKFGVTTGVLLNRREGAFARLYGKNRKRLELLLPKYFHLSVAEIRKLLAEPDRGVT